MIGVEEMNIGVIGSADGPTAIYLASSVNWGLIIGAAIFISAVIAFFVLKKKKRDWSPGKVDCRFMYVFSIVLIVASNVLYNICQKSTPRGANPFSSLLVTYVTAAILTLCAFPFHKTDEGFLQTFHGLNWTSIALGISIVGLELGYLMAYRAGWNISVGSLVANIFLIDADSVRRNIF